MKKRLEKIYDLVSRLMVSGDGAETVAAIRAELRAAYRELAKEKAEEKSE